MASQQYVPRRIKTKIDKSTISMTENGLFEFYESFTEFMTRVHVEKILNATDEEPRALVIDDLRSPLTVCSYFIGFAVLVFLIETVVHVFKARCKRRIHIQRE